MILARCLIIITGCGFEAFSFHVTQEAKLLHILWLLMGKLLVMENILEHDLNSIHIRTNMPSWKHLFLFSSSIFGEIYIVLGVRVGEIEMKGIVPWGIMFTWSMNLITKSWFSSKKLWKSRMGERDVIIVTILCGLATLGLTHLLLLISLG